MQTLTHYSQVLLSIPAENIRKPFRGIEKQHRAVKG